MPKAYALYEACLIYNSNSTTTTSHDNSHNGDYHHHHHPHHHHHNNSNKRANIWPPALSSLCGGRTVFGPEEGEATAGAGLKQMGLEAVTTRRIVKARGYGGLAPGEALARALGVALALGCISPRRYLPACPRVCLSASDLRVSTYVMV